MNPIDAIKRRIASNKVARVNRRNDELVKDTEGVDMNKPDTFKEDFSKRMTSVKPLDASMSNINTSAAKIKTFSTPSSSQGVQMNTTPSTPKPVAKPIVKSVAKSTPKGSTTVKSTVKPTPVNKPIGKSYIAQFKEQYGNFNPKNPDDVQRMSRLAGNDTPTIKYMKANTPKLKGELDSDYNSRISSTLLGTTNPYYKGVKNDRINKTTNPLLSFENNALPSKYDDYLKNPNILSKVARDEASRIAKLKSTSKPIVISTSTIKPTSTKSITSSIISSTPKYAKRTGETQSAYETRIRSTYSKFQKDNELARKRTGKPVATNK